MQLSPSGGGEVAGGHQQWGLVALPRPVDGRAPRRRGSGTSAFFTHRPGSKSSCGLLDILLGPEMTWSRIKRMVQPPSMAVSMNIKIRQYGSGTLTSV